MAYSKEWRVERSDGTVATRSNTWSPPGSHPVGYGVKVITKDGELIRIEGDDYYWPCERHEPCSSRVHICSEPHHPSDEARI